MFDFLIDIVPREEAAAKRTSGPGGGTTPAQGSGGQGGMMPPQQAPQQSVQPGGPQGGAGQGAHHLGGPHEGYPMGVPNQMPQPGIYTPQVPSEAAYGQPQSQVFEGMYGYNPMNTQPVSLL